MFVKLGMMLGFVQKLIVLPSSPTCTKPTVSCRFGSRCKTKKMNKSLKEIQMKPTCLEKIHESCFRSYSILEQVLIMVERGDSKETIFEVVDFLKEYPVDTMFTRPSNGS